MSKKYHDRIFTRKGFAEPQRNISFQPKPDCKKQSLKIKKKITPFSIFVEMLYY